MKQPFIIVFDDLNNTQAMEEFAEVVRSNYVSKKVRKNAFVIAVDSPAPHSKEILLGIKSKLKTEVPMIVVQFENFYGFFSDDITQWLKTTFPQKNYRE